MGLIFSPAADTRPVPHTASSIPSSPPQTERTMLSVNNCRTRLESRDRAKMTLVARTVVIFFCNGPVELPLGFNECRWERTKVRSHHPDNRVSTTVELNCLADNIRIAGKAALPEAVPEH